MQHTLTPHELATLPRCCDATFGYLRRWDDWAENGAPNGGPFWRGYGLCGNAEFCDTDNGLVICCDLKRLFPGQIQPFGGEADYKARQIAQSQHLNPRRRAWVKAVIAWAEANGRLPERNQR